MSGYATIANGHVTIAASCVRGQNEVPHDSETSPPGHGPSASDNGNETSSNRNGGPLKRAVLPKMTDRQLPDGFSYLNIPRCFFEMKGLSLQKKVLLAEVFALQGTDGCRAMNRHFGLMIDASDRQVRAHLTELQKAGHLIISNRNGNKRRMWISDEIGKACGRVSILTDKANVAFDDNAETLQLVDGRKPYAPAEEVPEVAAPARPLAERKHQKDFNKKPTVGEHAARDLPGFIPRGAWAEFVDMRCKEHGPFSDRAAVGIVREIERLHGEGHDPQLLLELATNRCWQTVYAKDEATKRGSNAGRAAQRRFVLGAASNYSVGEYRAGNQRPRLVLGAASDQVTTHLANITDDRTPTTL